MKCHIFQSQQFYPGIKLTAASSELWAGKLCSDTRKSILMVCWINNFSVFINLMNYISVRWLKNWLRLLLSEWLRLWLANLRQYSAIHAPVPFRVAALIRSQRVEWPHATEKHVPNPLPQQQVRRVGYPPPFSSIQYNCIWYYLLLKVQ